MRDAVIHLRVERGEKERWRAAAGHYGLSRWMVDAARQKLVRELNPPPDPEVVLCRHGFSACTLCEDADA